MSSLLLTLLLGCGDEPAAPEAAPADPAAAAPTEAAAPTGATPPADGGTVTPAVPPPGGATTASPENPNAGGPGAVPTGGRPPPTGFKVNPGDGVKVSGTVVYTGSTKGTLRLDVLHNIGIGSPPELMHSLTLASPGAWEVEVPKTTGELSFVAYVDTNDNGPEPTEPSADAAMVTVRESDITGVTLSVTSGREEKKTLADGTVVTPVTDPNATVQPK